MRDELNRRLTVWEGPPPADMAKDTGLLTRMCKAADADTAIVDSLKDAAIGLTDDTVGAGYNRSRQTAVAAGVQLIELHHTRKILSGAKAERPTIDDLYGSTWLTAGAGSVVLLNGAPGDSIIGLHHLKQPAAEFGPLKIIHDHGTGLSSVWHATDLALLARQPGGVSALQAAQALFETDKPTNNEKEKARRRLQALERNGDLVTVDRGDQVTSKPQLWGPP